MIKSITLRLSAWRRERETVRELSMLTDRELSDLGIGRGDIPSVATGTFHEAKEAFVRPSAANDAGSAQTSLAA